MSESLNTEPKAWPKCPTCDIAWVLRRCISISEGWLWAWQRDCKHKGVNPIVEQAK